MNSSLPFCPDPFWDADLTWNTERPSLTACFRQTALVYLPLAAAALLAPLEMGSLLRRPTRWDCYFGDHEVKKCPSSDSHADEKP